MKKVLLVGDLRTHIHNYGAVATSECLINEIKKRNVELRCIDGRSFTKETPEQNWEVNIKRFIDLESSKKEGRGFKLPIKRLKYEISKYINIQAIKIQRESKPFIPAVYKEFDTYARQVKNNEKLRFERNQVEWADIIIINGEGNVVKGTDKFGYYRTGGLYVLFMAYLSKIIFKKKTYVINHTIDPGNRDVIEIIKNIYPYLDGVYVRENLSIKLLNSWGVYNARFVPDALFLYGKVHLKLKLPLSYLKRRDYSKPLICIGDSSGIQNKYKKVKWNVTDFFTKLINGLQEKGYQVAFIDGADGGNQEINNAVRKTDTIHLRPSNCNYHELYEIFKETKVYISGRWHTSILALQAGTPIILWGADSHKTEALYELIDYEYNFFDVDALPIHITDILNCVGDIINDPNPVSFNIIEDLQSSARDLVDML